MQVGLIGIGRMGRAMARNLLKGGHRVLAWDVSQSSLDEIKRDGAAIAASAREAFSGDSSTENIPSVTKRSSQPVRKENRRRAQIYI